MSAGEIIINAVIRSAAEPAPFYPDKMKLLVWRDGQGTEHPVSNTQDWQRRREHILQNMQQVMGPLPGADSRVPLRQQPGTRQSLRLKRSLRCLRQPSTCSWL